MSNTHGLDDAQVANLYDSINKLATVIINSMEDILAPAGVESDSPEFKAVLQMYELTRDYASEKANNLRA